MTTATYTLSDTRTLLHRNLLHAVHYPAMSLSTLLMPLRSSCCCSSTRSATRSVLVSASYITYLTPGVLIMTATSSMVGTAVSVCTRT